MRIKLSEKYQTEREDVCNKLINILNLGEDKSFLLSDLDEDEEKQNQIIDMKEEIQKYFSCFNISAFKPNFNCKRPYLSIVRSILRKQNYNIENSDFWIKYENGFLKRTIKYKIFRNN
jgi:hypothetical protein